MLSTIWRRSNSPSTRRSSNSSTPRRAASVPSWPKPTREVEQAGRVGRYTLGERIGHGGTAVVYKGLDPELGREVAIKVLHSYFIEEPRFLQRFRNEAATAAKLTHPNILHVYDFGETEGSVYIVTNYVPGGTLDDRFGGRLTTPEVMEFASPIASALDYAHERSVVHRDLKPGNILLDTDGTPILADFGIAKVLGEGVGPTLTKWTIGTPEYMSPEQALGQAVDHRSRHLLVRSAGLSGSPGPPSDHRPNPGWYTTRSRSWKHHPAERRGPADRS